MGCCGRRMKLAAKQVAKLVAPAPVLESVSEETQEEQEQATFIEEEPAVPEATHTE